MNPARSLVKPLCVIIAIQAACLAFGLWLHNHFVIASARWKAEEQVWLRLREGADEIRSPHADGSVGSGNRVASVAATLRKIPPPVGTGFLVVDSNWRLLFAGSAPHDKATSDWETGQTIWQQDLSRLQYTSSELLRGTVYTAAGPRQALGWSLEDGAGYAVLYSTVAAPKSTAEMITNSLPLGAVVAFFWIVGLQSIATYIAMGRMSETAPRKPVGTDEESLRRSQDLLRTRDAVIIGLAKLAEARDTDTGNHLDRIGLYCTALASSLRRHPSYRQLVSPGFLRLIRVSSALHDIGKVGIGDSVLLKPAPLNEEERIKMQAHTVLGGQCLQRIEQRLGTSNFLEMAREIALYHHERWDGSGYPFGLKGEQIPLAARIVAIADVYDALAFKRVYKAALPHDKCVDVIRAGSGFHFDPGLVKMFLEIQMQFREIARAYSAIRLPTSEESHTAIDVITVRNLEEKVLAAL